MQCPKCKSTTLHIAAIQTKHTQVICPVCGDVGTYIDFGLPEELNRGLVNTPENPIFEADASFFDLEDPQKAIKVTVHEQNGQSICNSWIFIYSCWYKLLEERVTQGQPRMIMLAEEVLRIMRKKTTTNPLGDRRIPLLLEGLQRTITDMMFTPKDEGESHDDT